MAASLRAGVAGAGVFGGYHAAKYATLPDVRLTAIYDVDLGRADALAAQHGAQAFDDLAAFLDAIDVLTVAAPAQAHARIGVAALRRGVPTLVEKPLAATREDASMLIAAARISGVTLACGHQERVVFEAMGLFAAPERPLSIEAVREAPWSPRGSDVSVALDLAIHDADLVMRLLGGAEPMQVKATGRRVNSPFWDHIEAEVGFPDGGAARLVASRAAEARRRLMRVTYPSGVVEVDFVARTFRNEAAFPLDADFAATAEGLDPLGANVARFLGAVRGQGAPLVSGEEAAAALHLALAMEEAAEIEERRR